MPKETKIICDMCGKETQNYNVFSKKVPPYYFLNVYVCAECYEKMFGEELKRFEQKQKEINNAK